MELLLRSTNNNLKYFILNIRFMIQSLPERIYDMKKASTFLFTLQFSFPNTNRIEISNSLSSTHSSHFSQSRSSVVLHEYVSMPSNFKMNHVVQVLPVRTITITHSKERATIKQPTLLQLLQVFYVAVFARGHYLLSVTMSHNSMSTSHNPTSTLLNSI